MDDLVLEMDWESKDFTLKKKFTGEQHLVCQYVMSLFNEYNIKTDSFNFDDAIDASGYNDNLCVIINPASAEDRLPLERTLFERRISYYYFSSEEVSFYLLSYYEVCTEAHIELMFDLSDIAGYLGQTPFFKNSVEVEKLEYRRILVVGEDISEEEADYADTLHAIYSYQNQKMYWICEKDGCIEVHD